MEAGAYPGLGGLFVHPVLDERVMAGNGVIGLELVEQLDAIDAVLVPWGGGGLTAGIASALAAVRPATRVVACEPETGAPLTASLAAGPAGAVDYEPSFVDGAGSKALLPAMWKRARPLVSRAVAVPLRETAAAVRLLATRGHVVAEGAGALALAAALAGQGGTGRVVCMVSGGNIDPESLAAILQGEMPVVRLAAGGALVAAPVHLVRMHVVVPPVVGGRERQGEPHGEERRGGDSGHQ